MNKENLESLIKSVEEFVLEKGKSLYKKNGLIIRYSDDASTLKNPSKLSISYKKLFGKEKPLYLREDGKIIHNYLTPVTIKELEKIVYKK